MREECPGGSRNAREKLALYGREIAYSREDISGFNLLSCLNLVIMLGIDRCCRVWDQNL
jgi:hypothetical protein